MRVSADEQRFLEGVYRWRSSERYCGPVPVITLKQSVEILHCIRALLAANVPVEEWVEHGRVFFFFGLADKSCSCVLNFLQSVSEKLWTTSQVGSCTSPNGTESNHKRESELLEQ